MVLAAELHAPFGLSKSMPSIAAISLSLS